LKAKKLLIRLSNVRAGSLAELAGASHLLHVALQPIAPDDERLLALIDAALKAPRDRLQRDRG